ncbi:hypothetical protein GCK72_004001 [Caenorhabditis remanei]|uniref:Uncharacterized protein n=1 Tax=Caenorhabditis remanei TaxID=31234 RepID=A0A6A5HA42_CAERE|nr:hypothetical protein GCK72_004001 [Caenorhabditis remanei]KAF1764055.1 hypothetical protein GCK72_004001 [Caenorhabditis remanei]
MSFCLSKNPGVRKEAKTSKRLVPSDQQATVPPKNILKCFTFVHLCNRVTDAISSLDLLETTSYRLIPGKLGRYTVRKGRRKNQLGHLQSQSSSLYSLLSHSLFYLLTVYLKMDFSTSTGISSNTSGSFGESENSGLHPVDLLKLAEQRHKEMFFEDEIRHREEILHAMLVCNIRSKLKVSPRLLVKRSFSDDDAPDVAPESKKKKDNLMGPFSSEDFLSRAYAKPLIDFTALHKKQLIQKPQPVDEMPDLFQRIKARVRAKRAANQVIIK